MRRTVPLLVGAALVVAACAPSDPAPEAEPTMSDAGSGSTRPTSSPTPTGDASPTAGPSTPEALPWGPTSDQLAQAESIVAEMTVEQQAGQVIVAKYAGLEPPVDLVAELGLGGVIMMGDNVGTPAQITQAASDLQAAVERPYPLIVSVDQEGGKVARVREPATEFPSYMTLGAARDPQLTTEVAQASGEELRALGYTAVFAPDADVTTGPDDPTIGSRSASSDPAVVSESVAASLAGYADAGILAVPKHFPGHGSVPADSHEELPVQTASVEELRARDFVPFRAAVEAGASAIMVAHIDLRAVDPGVPSSLSPKVIGLLRDELDFDGLVITDAQDMAAITETYGVGDAAVRALAAGADVLLMPDDARAAHAAVVASVGDGSLPAARLAEAATRGVALMLHEAAAAAGSPDPAVVGSNEELAYRASLAGMTVVSGACSGPLVDGAIQVSGGDESDQARLVAAAEAAGLTVGSGPMVHLLSGGQPGTGDIVVALDAPYGLAGSTAGTARIGLYGRTPGSFRALVDVLLGTATSGGTLPVPVDGAPQDGCG